jgi:hypothetical protein
VPINPDNDALPLLAIALSGPKTDPDAMLCIGCASPILDPVVIELRVPARPHEPVLAPHVRNFEQLHPYLLYSISG